MYKQITILTVLICFLAVSAHAAQMSVEPVYQNASQGDDITVNITVYPGDGEEVYGASYTLHFNNTILNATSLEKGPFLTQDGGPSQIQYPPTGINNTAGEIEYGETREGTVPGVTGCGVLTTITFQVIGAGISSLNLSDSGGALLYFAPPQGPIPTTLNNGSVDVKEGVCGDVDGKPGVKMNDGRQIYMNIIHGSEEYPLSDPWAANCDGKPGVKMNDGRQIYMNIIHGSEEYPLECCC